MIHKILKLIIILLLNTCINDLGQPFREAEHRIDKDKISREDAKKQITWVLALRLSLILKKMFSSLVRVFNG